MKLVWAWILVSIASGCTMGGDDSGASGSASSDAASGGSGGAGADAAGETASEDPPAIEGAWAQILFYASINDVPAVGKTNGSTTTVQRVTVERTGTSLTMKVEPCTIEVDNGTPVVATIIPDAFVRSLGITERTGSLVFEAGQWRYVQDRNLQLRGVKLEQPETDPLPTEGDDPQVWDQDEDGNPGVTVRITGITDGEVYVVQRDVHGLDGVVVGDRMDGLADWNTEQVVLGSDNPILDMQTSVVKDPDASASYFRSTRVDASKTCEAIVAEKDQLFSR